MNKVKQIKITFIESHLKSKISTFR